MSTAYKIVGAYYRKPAPAILDCMPLNQKLYLRFEYTNEYDPNAVMVIGKREEFLPAMSEAAQDILREKCANYGVEWETFNDSNEWHLGYIPRDTAPPELYASLKTDGDHECFFQPDLAGKPAIVIY